MEAKDSDTNSDDDVLYAGLPKLNNHTVDGYQQYDSNIRPTDGDVTDLEKYPSLPLEPTEDTRSEAN